MESNTTRGTLNRNPAGASETRPQSVAGCQSLGHSTPNSARMGTGVPETARPGHDQAPRNHRVSHGGQSSLGVSGLPSGPFPGVRRWTAPAQAKAASAAQSQAPAEAPRPAPQTTVTTLASTQFTGFARKHSRVAGMPYSTYHGIEEGLKAEDARTVAKAAQSPALELVRNELTVRLSRDRFQMFERIAAREHRPVKAVIAECLEGCAIQTARGEANAMRRAAAASDERERSGYADDKAEYAHRCAGAGYVEIQLALLG